MSSFSIRRSTKREAFSIVQDALLEHPSLSLNARTVLAWMLGRPDGWEIQIAYMLSKLNITENVWRKIKNDLVRHGFFSQIRVQTEGGKITWVQEATDEPLCTGKKHATKNHPLKTTHGFTKHGKPPIKKDIYKQNNFTIPPTQPLLPTSERSELDLSISYQLKKILAQSKSLLSQISSQELADSMEASLRLGEATGNRVRVPIKLLDYLKKLSIEELEDRGKPILVEREKKKRQLEIKSSYPPQKDEKARVEGEKMIDKLRRNRHKNK